MTRRCGARSNRCSNEAVSGDEGFAERAGRGAAQDRPALARPMTAWRALRVGYRLQLVARRGRHGRGVPRARREARARRRDQDPAARLHERSGSARALRARGADARRAQPSATSARSTVSKRPKASASWCSNSSRARRSRRRLAGPRRRSAPTHAGLLGCVEALDDRAADRRRARSRAREGHHPPRPEAREHQDHAGRRRQGARLRPGESGQRRQLARS